MYISALMSNTIWSWIYVFSLYSCN